jgi:hypothetical protein
VVGKVIQTTLPLLVARKVNNKTTDLIAAKRSTKQHGNARSVTASEFLFKGSASAEGEEFLEGIVI